MNILSYVHLRNIHRSTGVGRVARELTENFRRMPGVELHVLADREDYRRVVHQVGAPWTSLPYHFFKRDTSAQQLEWLLTKRPRAEDFWSDAEIVHCTAESYVPARKARLVVTCHDAQHFESGAHLASFWLAKQRLKWRLLFARLEREADMLHAISHYAAERTAHFFPAFKKRLRVVPNAASDAFFRPATANGREVLQKLGIADRPYVLAPGGLQYRKNADLILTAWPSIARQYPDLSLVVINHPDPAYLEQARALGPSCVLAGFQEEQQLVALYQAATLVWFPTRYDGFGMPVMEAMAAGAPVITSNTTGIPEVAGDAAILLSPDDPKAHVTTIVELISDTSARETMTAKGRQRAAAYTWEQSAEKLATEFRSLL